MENRKGKMDRGNLIMAVAQRHVATFNVAGLKPGLYKIHATGRAAT